MLKKKKVYCLGLINQKMMKKLKLIQKIQKKRQKLHKLYWNSKNDCYFYYKVFFIEKIQKYNINFVEQFC